jgi:hypothetical protein
MAIKTKSNPDKKSQFAFYCYIDGRKITAHPDFKKFKRGKFLGHTKTGETKVVSSLDDASVYYDYTDLGIMGATYDDFVFADMFWVVEARVGSQQVKLWSFYSSDITKSGRDEWVQLNPEVFGIKFSRTKII